MNSLFVRATPSLGDPGGLSWPLPSPHWAWGGLSVLRLGNHTIFLSTPFLATVRYALPRISAFCFLPPSPHFSWPFFPGSLSSHLLDNASTQLLAPRDSVFGRAWRTAKKSPILSIFSERPGFVGFWDPVLIAGTFFSPIRALPFWGGSCLTRT